MVQYNWLLNAFLIFFLAAASVRLLLSWLNLKNLKTKGHHVPHHMAGEIDEATLARMTEYTVDSSRFGIVGSLFDDGLLLFILLSGILPWYGNIIWALDFPFIITSILFLAGYGAVEWIFGIPFDLYRTFVIEKKTWFQHDYTHTLDRRPAQGHGDFYRSSGNSSLSLLCPHERRTPHLVVLVLAALRIVPTRGALAVSRPDRPTLQHIQAGGRRSPAR